MDTSQMSERSVADGQLTAAPHTERMDASQMSERSVADGRLIARAHIERMDTSQMSERSVADGQLTAAPHTERMDASQMSERSVTDGQLIAPTHIERMDTSQKSERSVTDGQLIAPTHIERMDALQMYKRRVADGPLIAAIHIECTNPFQPSKVSVRQVAPVGNIRANSFGNTSTPSFQASADPSHRIIPFMLCNSATCSRADPAHAESIPRCEGTENAGAKVRKAAAVQQLVEAYVRGTCKDEVPSYSLFSHRYMCEQRA
jgi:hypothetical protein